MVFKLTGESTTDTELLEKHLRGLEGVYGLRSERFEGGWRLFIYGVATVDNVLAKIAASTGTTSVTIL